MLVGFDPEQHEIDRRLFYEVTGLQIYQDEFRDEDSSDQSADGTDQNQHRLVWEEEDDDSHD